MYGGLLVVMLIGVCGVCECVCVGGGVDLASRGLVKIEGI